MTSNSFDFKANVAKALQNRQLRKNLKFAMDTMIRKRNDLFADQQELENLRDKGSAVRQRSLNRLPRLLESLEQKCRANGIKVHWATTTQQANKIVLEVIQSHKATSVVKGKSMVSEEMHLNAFLNENNITPLETDLGEFIIQLAEEKPSHIIVPAIHKNRSEIAGLFHEKLPETPYTEDVTELTEIARNILRENFQEARIGISGVNMAVAETGTLCLVENEGNGRMCTTLPPVHIALMGLEKVVENLADIAPLLKLLTGSATGQRMTTYFNMINSPRKPGEKDGPKEVHLVILDNGRTSIYQDQQLRKTLKCIRCGTCLNHCPVYTRIGGHAYEFTYPGPIGTILTPQMEGLDKTDELTNGSSLCNACEDVCPVKIPIPDLIRRLRNEKKAGNGLVKGHGAGRVLSETALWKGWALVNQHPRFQRAGLKTLNLLGGKIPKFGAAKTWSKDRELPKAADKSLVERMKQEDVEYD